MSHEVALGYAWIKAVLLADTTLSGFVPGGVWRSVAPRDTPAPYIIMGYLAGSDTTTMNGVRILSSLPFQVKAVGPESMMESVVNAAARIDDLLSPSSGGTTGGTTPGGRIDGSYREYPLQYDDDSVSGELWSHLGGVYRLIIEKA